jgi:hypothetical protein
MQMKAPSLNEFSVSELLKLQAGVMEELNKRGVLRSQNNPTGDYAEYLVAKELGLKLEFNSRSGFDATDESGSRIQIKGRRVTLKNPSRQLGVIRDLEKKQFDYLIGLVFDDLYSVNHVLKIPHEIIADYAEFSNHQRGHILHLSGRVLSDKRVEDITSRFATV